MDAEVVLEEMKTQGISGAIVRKDGIQLHSTFAITESGAKMLAAVSNIASTLIKRSGDTAKETEIAFPNLILIIIPIGDYLFAGAIKNREHKPIVRKFAIRAKGLL
jgi:hypothetical protein